ncbi:hypothetical protein XENORESO_010821 [Xenotaenia resolanae]|uniref:Uncharacterized protein n=1 Tax=Xenotaenia resolanae TaxID=208358 RepID=A0ABV0X089_9TELE
MFKGVWELQPQNFSPEPPFCFQLQAQLLKSHLRITHQPACPPSNVKPSNHSGVSWKRRNKALLRKLFTACQPQATMEKDLPRTPPLETPRSSTSSSPTFIRILK